MATTRQIIRSSPSLSPMLTSFLSRTSRFLTTSSKPQPEHEYSEPSEFLGCWETPKDPKEAEAKLAMLRRDYAKQVKELRKEYFYEMEFQRQEKQRKDEAKKESLRLAKEERKAAKAAMAQVKAAERKIAEEEFRQTLLKERAEKLEYWRKREKKVEEKKNEKKKLMKQQSSMWIGEDELEKKVLEAIVDSSPL